MVDLDELRRLAAKAAQAAQDAATALRKAEEQSESQRYQTELAAMSPAQREARRIVDKACADPDMWATHGSPGATKLLWLEREIAKAIEQTTLETVEMLRTPGR